MHSATVEIEFSPHMCARARERSTIAKAPHERAKFAIHRSDLSRTPMCITFFPSTSFFLFPLSPSLSLLSLIPAIASSLGSTTDAKSLDGIKNKIFEYRKRARRALMQPHGYIIAIEAVAGRRGDARRVFYELQLAMGTRARVAHFDE